MKLINLIPALIILLSLGACQQNDPASVTLVPESPSAAVQADLPPTREVRTIADRPQTETPVSASESAAQPNALIFTVQPLDRPTIVPYIEPTMGPDTTLVGRTVEGRSIIAREMGSGARTIMLVGGMHGGWELNTVALINELITHFDTNPDDLLAGVSLIFIPAANPDGLMRGRDIDSRFNANGVDLNRNWGCGWSADAVWQNQPVDAGEGPFSEPESQAISTYIEDIKPVVVLFYHSAAAGVFAGSCGGDHGSAVMSQLYGQAAGYTYGQAFSAYPVTGTAATWVNSIGIASADVELRTQSDTDFARNLAGIMALQEWLTQ